MTTTFPTFDSTTLLTGLVRVVGPDGTVWYVRPGSTPPLAVTAYRWTPSGYVAPRPGTPYSVVDGR